MPLAGPLRRESDDHACALTFAGLDRKFSLMQIDQTANDRQTEARSLLRRLDRKRPPPETFQYQRNLVRRNAVSGVRNRDIMPACFGLANLNQNLIALESKLSVICRTARSSA